MHWMADSQVVRSIAQICYFSRMCCLEYSTAAQLSGQTLCCTAVLEVASGRCMRREHTSCFPGLIGQ